MSTSRAHHIRLEFTDAQWLKAWTGATGQQVPPGAKRDELLKMLRIAEHAVLLHQAKKAREA